MSSPDIWAARRQRLCDRLGDGLLLLPTARETLRNGDVHHSYRPDSDFSYLTGFPEPGAMLGAWRTGRGTHESVLFVRPRDKEREIWDGRRFGKAGAKRHFGVDDACSVADMWERIEKLVAAHKTLYWTLGRDPELDARLFRVFAKLRTDNKRRNPPAHPTIVDPRPALHELRLIKETVEIETLVRAAAVTAEAHVHAMRTARPGMTEYEVQAELEEVFRKRGSRRNGYDSIVASGQNACVLHYVDNRRTLRRGDLLLLDAGAEVDGYTADITRTWPVNGTFTEAQRAVYEVVLRAQKAAIRAVKPGRPWDAMHKASLRWITKGLIELGVLRGRLPKLLEKGSCRQWFMHGTSHWLGMDVHDVGAYQDEAGKPIRLRPGMVLTIEPGLYFGATDKRVPKALRGIGVRIEDDVLVTRSGNRVLTAAAPKEVREVEAACAR
jgi:Xaa-Pro aminopeptidase